MRIRLFLSFILVMLVSIASVVIATRLSAASEVHAYMYGGGMRSIDDLIASLKSYYGQNGTWQGAEALFPVQGHGGMGFGGMMGQGMMSQRLQLTDSRGILLLDTEQPSPSGSLGPEVLSNAYPLISGNQTVGYLVVEGGMTFGPRDQSLLLARLTRAALIAALISGAISLILVVLLSYGLLRPVQDLTRAAQSLAAGDLSRRVPVRGNDELATLGGAFNHMAESLQNSEESRRAMTADIAHELRTPLAIQRAHLEALQDGVYTMTPENLTPVWESNALLTRLVDDLRTLALADEGRLSLERAPLALSPLLSGILDRFQPQASESQVRLSLDMVPPPPSISPLVMADAGRLEQILGNLLSNALRHTPAGGEVRLSLAYNASSAIISVHDSGPGIPEEALPYLFERFYRADRSRSRLEGGTGLGLAIAQRLAEAHAGTLTAANAPGGGALFTLTLPLSGGKDGSQTE